MASGQYILKDGHPIPCDNLMEWGRWMQKADRKVAETQIGKVSVSTVFLGLDHQYGDGLPLVFETMIFGGYLDDYCERYATMKEAKQGHVIAVHKAKRNWLARTWSKMPWTRS